MMQIKHHLVGANTESRCISWAKGMAQKYMPAGTKYEVYAKRAFLIQGTRRTPHFSAILCANDEMQWKELEQPWRLQDDGMMYLGRFMVEVPQDGETGIVCLTNPEGA